MKRRFQKGILFRKGYLYQEILPAVFSLIIIGLVLLTFSSQTQSAKAEYEYSAPKLKNQFPISFVHTFLHIELNEVQKEKLSIEKNVYFTVKDLLMKEYGSEEDKIFMEIREIYLRKMEGQQLLNAYLKTENSLRYGTRENLLIRKEVSTLNTLFCLKDENYYFYLPYLPNIDSTIVVLLFSDSLCLQPGGFGDTIRTR